MAKVSVVYLQVRDGHAVGDKAELEGLDVQELMRQGVVRWLEAVAAAPVTTATPPPAPAPEPAKS